MSGVSPVFAARMLTLSSRAPVCDRMLSLIGAKTSVLAPAFLHFTGGSSAAGGINTSPYASPIWLKKCTVKLCPRPQQRPRLDVDALRWHCIVKQRTTRKTLLEAVVREALPTPTPYTRDVYKVISRTHVEYDFTDDRRQ